MAVSEVPAKFKTSDGREFDDKEEAERHDKFVAAVNDYREAQRCFLHHMARTQRTADGLLFESTPFQRYWRVTDGIWGMPELSEVSFYGWDFTVSEHDELIIRRAEAGKWEEFRISELYSNKRRAEEALLAAQEEWLAARANEVAALRRRIIPQPAEHPSGS